MTTGSAETMEERRDTEVTTSAGDRQGDGIILLLFPAHL